MTAIRLRGPADVLASLPYQLGYHPEDSVVVLALDDGVVGLIERLDLPPASAVVEAAGSLVQPVLRPGFDAVLVLGFESVEGRARPVLDHLAHEFGREHVDIVHRVLVRQGRWFSLDCPPDCCSVDGQALPNPTATPAVADFVRRGIAPRARRADVAKAIAADHRLTVPVAAELSKRPPAAAGSAFFGADCPGAELSAAARRLALLSVWRDVLGVEGERARDDGPWPDEARSAGRARPVRPAEVAELVRSLRDLQLRDGLVAWLCPGFLEAGDLDDDLADALQSTLGPFPDAPSAATMGADGPDPSRGVLMRLEELVRAVPDGEAAPMATVLAYVAWYHGEGTLARVSLERALADDPGYRLAGLVEQLVDLGLRPSALGLGPPQRRHLRAVQFPDAGR